jgi:Flp pilus assembly protein TadG
MLARIWDLCKEDQGTGTALAGLCMFVLLGTSAMVADIGHLVSVKSELQRVADAASMAGARALWPTALPMLLNPPANPSCVNAKNVAQLVATSAANTVDGVTLSSVNLTISVGNYDYATGDFTPKTDCTLTSNAVKVVARKTIDKIFFARIWNVTSLRPEASAIGTMGFAKAVGKGTLPIAINKFYATPGTEIYVNFNPDPNDNAGWFADPPDKAGAATFTDYINNAACPPLKIGDVINLQNGQDTSALSALKTKLTNDYPDGWDTFLPVVDASKFNQLEPIVAFVPFRILEVMDSGNFKGIRGKVVGLAECASALPGSDVNCGALAPVKAVN